MHTEALVELFNGLIQQNRDGVLVIDDRDRIVTHNAALVEMLEQPQGSRFDSTLRLGPINLQRLLVRAAIAAGQQDVVGRARWEALDFEATLEFRKPPLPVRITSNTLPLPEHERPLRLVTIRTDVCTPGTTVNPGESTQVSPLESADPHCQERLNHARRAVAAGSRLLLLGETGTGKTLVARALHFSGPRASGPWIDVHCAALPEFTLESELFGHARGAFPGASAEREGRIGTAAGGTLVLDEIGAMSAHLQAVLQRVLGEGRFERVGENRTRTLEAGIISTAGMDLDQRVADGRFRPDLYYRLAGVTVHLPPLRERPGDLSSIVKAWSDRHSIAINAAGYQLLQGYPWPGNFRELHHQLAALRLRFPTGSTLTEHEIEETLSAPGYGTLGILRQGSGQPPEPSPPPFSPEEKHEREVLRATLAAHQGNRSLAARSLGIDRTTLWRKLHRLRLIPERDTI